MTVLPGLHDDAALARAYATVRGAGLVGIGVHVASFLAMRLGLSDDVYALPLVFSLCWIAAMMGLGMVIDARRVWIGGGQQGLVLQAVILFNIAGTVLAAGGIGGAAYVSYAVLSS